MAVVLTSRIGGTSGPIWGTAFLRAGARWRRRRADRRDEVVAALRAAIEGIKQRGDSDVGDKTLLDALVPGGRRAGGGARRRGRAGPRSARGGDGARRRPRRPRAMLAKRGRAAYTGERSSRPSTRAPSASR